VAIINKETGKSPQYEQKIELKNGTEKITNPQNVEKLNSYLGGGGGGGKLQMNC
jgi:hypothetical protein